MWSQDRKNNKIFTNKINSNNNNKINANKIIFKSGKTKVYTITMNSISILLTKRTKDSMKYDSEKRIKF
jgi:hypothetical protein